MENLPISGTQSLGALIRARRLALGLRQHDLALSANVGARFIVDIENGKETCQIGLTLRLLEALGVRLVASTDPAPVPPAASEDELGIEDEPGGYQP
ncbi:helix-turn-helix transcriptional regulator [Microvirga puerhi]|uniref:Helix-turn-helix transcriptional regulator n=1 Tax=Microvirga puerhi TaxID=2876078 RepID=A0ABS7VQL9_9HYPH|nr:helix-turn-helix transcriptional regulator [Microvirga puerhi]MBZ6077355.1 helix-turn-helix transcriptional regulator [Microvirga puerhi]